MNTSPFSFALAILLLGATMAPATDVPALPAPLASHPGNIFLTTEDVTISVPDAYRATWSLFDYEGKNVASGAAADGRAKLGRLPVGYYELKPAGGQDRITLGVLEPLKAATPANSPICIDVAMAWFYKDEAAQRGSASLCSLAGINWVRDRLLWRTMEPQPNAFVGPNIYDDTARIQSEAGLPILQVIHQSPGWNKSEDPKRFPADLRDAYRFFREMAKRWKGQVLAFEPWNEADISVFGGHTGSEMASLQKASYLGLKAGNPDIIVGQNCFATDHHEFLEDLNDNEAWPYFDTYNFHHYHNFDYYPTNYRKHRAVSAGKPIWVTECNRPVHWSGDEKKKEPSDPDLRIQAERVARVYSGALHNGASMVFYFILGHYVEGQTQFGVLHEDLTPRPAYLAVAAVGRLLADAKPLGEWKPNEQATGYLFRTRTDGREQFVLVAWSEADPQDVKLDAPVEVMYDHLGRKIPGPWTGQLRLTGGPIFAVMGTDPSSQLKLVPPPAPAPLLGGSPSPVVLQFTEKQVEGKRSVYAVSSTQRTQYPLWIYNFSEKPVKGRLSVAGPEGWILSLPDSIELAPNDRKPLTLTVDATGKKHATTQPVKITGDFQDAGRPVLSIRLVEAPTY